jgi:hypothetical protein
MGPKSDVIIEVRTTAPPFYVSFQLLAISSIYLKIQYRKRKITNKLSSVDRDVAFYMQTKIQTLNISLIHFKSKFFSH